MGAVISSLRQAIGGSAPTTPPTVGGPPIEPPTPPLEERPDEHLTGDRSIDHFASTFEPGGTLTGRNGAGQEALLNGFHSAHLRVASDGVGTSITVSVNDTPARAPQRHYRMSETFGPFDATRMPPMRDAFPTSLVLENDDDARPPETSPHAPPRPEPRPMQLRFEAAHTGADGAAVPDRLVLRRPMLPPRLNANVPAIAGRDLLVTIDMTNPDFREATQMRLQEVPTGTSPATAGVELLARFAPFRSQRS
jgi:hypothetical protein